MKHEISMSLVITHLDVSPDTISTHLGLPPTETWFKGDPIKNTLLKHEHTSWRLSSGADKTLSFDIHLRSLIGVLKSHRQEFMDVCRKYPSRLLCAIYFSASSDASLPEVELDKESLEVLAALMVTVTFDFYLVP